ncbi:MAG: hypothetical protein K6G24_07840 [Lachnospiraceae bacterium]|nr:hypothetical protein [Lachnospiraceae bacterium]
MKIELTERDKKLLTFMGIFVIIVCIGYWGILPQIKGANEYKDEIEEQELVQNIYEQKIDQLMFVQANNDELEKLIAGAKENYYPMMDSDAVDKLITTKVINEYKLMSYDLSIGERAVAGLSPYVYSNKALTGESDAEQKAMQKAASVISEDGEILFGEIQEAESGTTGIYMVTVQMRLGGDKKNITRLLDDLAATEKKLRLVDYSVDVEETVIPHEDGTEEVFTTDMLNLTVELYMCED